MTPPTAPREADRVVVLHALHAPLPELPAAVEGEEAVVVRAEVLPPATAEGLLPTSDGRQHRLSDPAGPCCMNWTWPATIPTQLLVTA